MRHQTIDLSIFLLRTSVFAVPAILSINFGKPTMLTAGALPLLHFCCSNLFKIDQRIHMKTILDCELLRISQF